MYWRDVELSLLAVGVTYRKFDYWWSKGWLGADNRHWVGSGHNRELTWESFAIARVIGQLTQAGYATRERTAEIARELVAVGGPGSHEVSVSVRVPSKTGSEA